MKSLTTAAERFGSPLPIMKYNFSAGIRIAAATGAATASAPLAPGAYLITATSDVYFSLAGAAGDAAHSMLLSGGLPMHMIIEDGQSISVRAVMMAGSVFAVPLA